MSWNTVGTHCARGVVGILAAKDCSLEILPKIDVAPGESVNHQNAAIRKRLIHMLAVALDLKVDTGAITDLAWQRETLLEILIHVFCDKLTEAVRKGMPRRYVEQEDDLSALRGRLDVARQFTRHAVNPSRLACQFDVLSEDTALNRIMKAAVAHLSRMSRSSANQQRLRELAFVYADIAEIPPLALRWGEVAIDRTNHRWQELLGMARLFLLNRYQTTTGGAGQGTALLFEMNTLFEEYVGRLISRTLAGADLTVSLQGGRLFCLAAETTERGLFQTKPDILIRHAGTVTHVIDTKWKRISSRIDDPKQRVSQGDVYQMMAYAQLYHAPRLTLLYSHHPGLGSVWANSSGPVAPGSGAEPSGEAPSQENEPINPVIDSTGLQIFGEGEWLQNKHKTKAKRKSWRKLHLGLDLTSGEIIRADLTMDNVGDPTALPGASLRE